MLPVASLWPDAEAGSTWLLLSFVLHGACVELCTVPVTGRDRGEASRPVCCCVECWMAKGPSTLSHFLLYRGHSHLDSSQEWEEKSAWWGAHKYSGVLPAAPFVDSGPSRDARSTGPGIPAPLE